MALLLIYDRMWGAPVDAARLGLPAGWELTDRPPRDDRVHLEPGQRQRPARVPLRADAASAFAALHAWRRQPPSPTLLALADRLADDPFTRLCRLAEARLAGPNVRP